LDTEDEAMYVQGCVYNHRPVSDATYADPEIVYLEIKKDVSEHGTLAYHQIEAMYRKQNYDGRKSAFRSSKYDGTKESAYRCYGVRLCLDYETEGKARNTYIVWGLRNPMDVNQETLKQGIAEFYLDQKSIRYDDVDTLLRQRDAQRENRQPVQVETSPPKIIPIDAIQKIIAQKKRSAEQYDRWIEEVRREIREN
jgi:hypothetical protein